MDRNNLLSDIYCEYHARILRYLERLVGELEAEEVTQVVFEKVNKNLNSFKGESKLSTWIYRIATNTAMDKLKSSSFKHSHAGPLAPLPIHLPEIEGPVSKASDNLNSPEKK